MFFVLIMTGLLLGCGIGKNELFLGYSIKSIQLIVDDDVKCEGVFNGNKKIIKVEDFDKMSILNPCGITIILDNDNFDTHGFIVNNNIEIVNKYILNGNIVYDCKFYHNVLYGFNTIQIVMKNECVIIGFPMILNSF